MSKVSSVIASTFGVRPPADFSWDGLFASNLFETPAAAVTVIVDGMSDLDLGASASFPLTHGTVDFQSGVQSVVSGHTDSGHPSVAAVVADATGAIATTVSVSADAEAARAAGYEGAASHLVSRHGGRYVDEAANTAAFTFPDFSVEFLGTAASFDMTSWTVTYDGVKFPVEATAFFQELQTMAVASDKLAGAASPAVATFTVTTFAGLAQKHGADSAVGVAAKKAVAATVAHIKAATTTAFGANALVLAVALETVADTQSKGGNWFANDAQPGFDIVAHVNAYKNKKTGRRSRRSVEDATFAARGGFGVTPNGTKADSEVECVGYKCSCYKVYAPLSNFHGRPWVTSIKAEAGVDSKQGCLSSKNSTTGASTPCYLDASDPEKTEVKCDEICSHQKKWCPCNTTGFTADFLYPMHLEKHECTECALGYKLSQKGCYLETPQRSASVQIGFWTGLSGVAALSGSWYALHTMTNPMFASLDQGDGIPGLKLKGT